MREITDDLPLWSAPFGLMLLDTVRFREGIKVLDIGSGSGFPMLELAERLGETCHVYGIDPAQEAVEMVNRKILLKGIRNAEIIQGVSEKLPFQNEYFGLIVANNGLNNVQDEKKVLAECFRVAAENSQMVLTMNLPYSMIEFYEIFEQVLNEFRMYEECRKMKEHITQKRKPAEYWKESILEAGFSISTVNVDGFKLRFSNGTAFLNHSFIRKTFRQSWEEILPPEKRKTIFDIIREKLNQKAKDQEELVMSIPYVCFDCYK
jgi:ubiquinone/menaquinone biosynthesis C-methylase UbiE